MILNSLDHNSEVNHALESTKSTWSMVISNSGLHSLNQFESIYHAPTMIRIPDPVSVTRNSLVGIQITDSRNLALVSLKNPLNYDILINTDWTEAWDTFFGGGSNLS